MCRVWKGTRALVALCLVAAAMPVEASELLRFDIHAGLEYAQSQGQLHHEVRLYWGEEQHPTPEQTFGVFEGNIKVNAIGKSADHACAASFALAVRSLQERALREGGNAVVNIRSYYKRKPLSSTSEYLCNSGHFAAGAALLGTIVKLP